MLNPPIDIACLWQFPTPTPEVQMAVTWDMIRKQFTQVDIDHMKQVTGGSLDLGDCQNVRQNAQAIYDQVNSKAMPPGNPWKQEWIDNFKAWMDAGAPCP
jgi:hypothetical protein